MRVLMVTPCYYPVKGGTETAVRNLSILLNKINVHTDVMTFNMDLKWKPKWQGKTEIIDGITTFKIPALNWHPFSNSYRVTLAISLVPSRFTNILKNYDIIHFHEFDLSFPLFSLLVRKPKIIHCHGGDFGYLKRYHLSRMLLKHLTSFYISISNQMTQELLKLGFQRSKIAYIPNGVDTERFTPKAKKEDNLLLFVGRLASSKGLHILLKSFQYLEKPVRLVVIGPKSSEVSYNQKLLELFKKETRKGKHKITYLGPMDQADIVKWYQKASILVLPSFWEGFPVTILEALSCETPVVATPVGGVPEVVKNYQNGILTPINDPAALARAIQFLLENKEVRTRFGREGRKQVVKYYSLEASVERLCRLYKQINS